MSSLYNEIATKESKASPDKIKQETTIYSMKTV